MADREIIDEPGKLTLVRRIRFIPYGMLTKAPNDLYFQMCRNHVFFSHKLPWTEGDRFNDNFKQGNLNRKRLKEFQTSMSRFLEHHCQGLYSYHESDENGVGWQHDYNFYFEKEEDLDLFLKNFVILHKLST